MRAISILLVLFGHLNGTQGFGNFDLKSRIGDIANLGVTVFFAISGYLITRILMKEEYINGSISLKNFYIRRFVRLFPVFFVYMVFLFVLNKLQYISVRNMDWAYAFTYTMNYNVERSWQVGHLWSLSVEEQFYLLWPFIIYRSGFKSAMLVAKFGLVLAVVYRLAIRLFLSKTTLAQMEAFPEIVDSIAVGCLLAGYQKELQKVTWYKKIKESPFFLSILVAIFLINILRKYSIINIFGTSVMNVLIAVMIDGFISRSGSFAFKVLNNKALVFVGVLSYSIYVWQQLFLNRSSHDFYCTFPVNLLLVCVVSVAVHYLIEKPALKLNQRFRRG